MEDGLFPSMMSINPDDRTDLEERRLCYVGITRTKKELVLTSARQRMVNGETRYCKPAGSLRKCWKDCWTKNAWSRCLEAMATAGTVQDRQNASGFGSTADDAGFREPVRRLRTGSTFGKGIMPMLKTSAAI